LIPGLENLFTAEIAEIAEKIRAKTPFRRNDCE
jgi:hypothetical protein